MLNQKTKTIRVSEADYDTWEMVKEQARAQNITISEFILRACFNEVHENRRLAEIQTNK